MQLVALSTQDVSNAEPITTSLIVSKEFGKAHKTVLRDIRAMQEKVSWDGYKIVPNQYIDNAGKVGTEYLLNEPAFIFLVMGYTGEKASKIKDAFIQAFYKMKAELLARMQTRAYCKYVRRSLTNSIRDFVKDEGNFKKFAYGNYTRLIYKHVLGKTKKELKEERNIPETAELRNYLRCEELEKVQEVESKVAAFLEMSQTDDDKENYEKVKRYLSTLLIANNETKEIIGG